MRVGVLLFVLAACGAPDRPVSPPPAPSPPIVTPPVAKPVTVDGMRFDRPTKPLGLGTRYEVPDVEDLAFCPDDRELVTLGKGKLRWVSAEHGGILREVAVPEWEPDEQDIDTQVGASPVDCRADGAALLVAEHAAILVPRNGSPVRASGVRAARFAADGTVRTLSLDGYGSWDGIGEIKPIVKPGDAARLGDGGALVHAHDGAFWLRRDTKETRIGPRTTTGSTNPRGIREFTASVSVAADGAVAGFDDMSGETFAWVKGKHVKLADSIVGMPALAATKWFVMNYKGSLWVFDRPSIQSTHLDHPCGGFPREDLENAMGAIAISRDGERVAIACGPLVGIRILRIATLGVVAGRMPMPLVAAQWNGDRLATRDIAGMVQIWRDTKHDDHAFTMNAETLSWWGDDVLVDGTTYDGGSQRYSLTTKKTRRIDPEIYFSARARELTLHVTGEPAIVVQRGDDFVGLPYPDKRRLAGVTVSPDGKQGLVMTREDDGDSFGIVVVNPVASTVRMTKLTATAIAASDQHLVISLGTELSYVVGRDSTPRAVKLTTTEKPITALAYSPDGRVLAVGSDDGSVAFYAEGKLIVRRKAHGAAVKQLVWGHELISIATDQVLRWTFEP